MLLSINFGLNVLDRTRTRPDTQLGRDQSYTKLTYTHVATQNQNQEILGKNAKIRNAESTICHEHMLEHRRARKNMVSTEITFSEYQSLGRKQKTADLIDPEWNNKVEI